MIVSAPLSSSTVRFWFSPMNLMDPAGICLLCTSPAGVRITTAERSPTSALAIGMTCPVSSDERENSVAMP
jgi:hypothetical protein